MMQITYFLLIMLTLFICINDSYVLCNLSYLECNEKLEVFSGTYRGGYARGQKGQLLTPFNFSVTP